MQYIQTGENNPEMRRVYFHLVDATDGITPEAGEAGGTTTISRNGRTPANTVNTLVAVDASKGDYYLELSLSEITTPGHLLLHYKSANTAHFAQEIQIMAFDPYTQFGALGVGGADVDYKRIKKLIDEAIGALPKPEEPKEPDLIPISEGLQAVLVEIRSLPKPKDPEKTDYSPILQKLTALSADIKAIKIPEQEEVDLTPILDKIDEAPNSLRDMIEQMSGIVEGIRGFFSKDVEDIKAEVGSIKKDLKKIPMIVMAPQAQEEEKKSVLDEYLKS